MKKLVGRGVQKLDQRKRPIKRVVRTTALPSCRLQVRFNRRARACQQSYETRFIKHSRTWSSALCSNWLDDNGAAGFSSLSRCDRTCPPAGRRFLLSVIASFAPAACDGEAPVAGLALLRALKTARELGELGGAPSTTEPGAKVVMAISAQRELL